MGKTMGNHGKSWKIHGKLRGKHGKNLKKPEKTL
jgi:hypothetical protein